MTDTCGRPDGTIPKDLPFEVCYTTQDGIEYIAGYTIDPEAIKLIDELNAKWVKLWIIDKQGAVIKTITRGARP